MSKEAIQWWAEHWDESSLNAKNPDAVTIFSVSRAISERERQSRQPDSSGQYPHRERPRIGHMSRLHRAIRVLLGRE